MNDTAATRVKTSGGAPIAWGLHAPELARVDVSALLLSVAAALAIFRFKVGTIRTLAACCAAGIALYFAGVTG